MKSIVLLLTCAMLAAQPVRAQESSLTSTQPNRTSRSLPCGLQARTRHRPAVGVFSSPGDSIYLWERDTGIISVAGFFQDCDRLELPNRQLIDNPWFLDSATSLIANWPSDPPNEPHRPAEQIAGDTVILISAFDTQSDQSSGQYGNTNRSNPIEPLSPVLTQYLAGASESDQGSSLLDGELPAPVSLSLLNANEGIQNDPTLFPASSVLIPEEQKSTVVIRVDSMFLHLSGGGRTYVPSPAFLIKPDAAGMPLSSVEDNRFLAVPRVTISRSTPGQTGWELSGFGRNDWQKSTGSITSDGTQSTSLASQLFSGEGNLLFPIDSLSNVEVLAGVRYFQFGEHLDLMSSQNTFTATSAVTNNLYGGQVGARFSREWNRWHLVGTGKFGVFDNSATVYQTSLITGNMPNCHLNGISFGTDIGLQARYPITQSFSFNAGYQFFLLDGVARAVGQIDRSGPVIGVNAKDNCILHGPTAGLEYRF